MQAKLVVGTEGDAYEREADRVASNVQRGDAVTVAPQLRVPDVQRMCTDCEDEQALAQRAPDPHGVRTSDATAAVQRALTSPGRPLPGAERSFFGQRLGADLSGVRIHDDDRASASASALGARAYTVGNDIVFARGEYAPQVPAGRYLLAHELAHTVQQSAGAGRRVQRWAVGAALPAAAPANWQLVPADHLTRLGQAEADIRAVLGSRTCQRYFQDNCTAGAAGSLQSAFDNAVIFHRNTDDTTFGVQLGTSPNIAYNTRAFRIGHWYMASTLLHEVFHTCDTNFDVGDERAAENAVEACHLHTPFLTRVRPDSGPVGTQVRLRGTNFGGRQGPHDQVLLNGAPVPVISWGFVGGPGSSAQGITIEIPADATSGDLVVVNNNVHSNPRPFVVT